MANDGLFAKEVEVISDAESVLDSTASDELKTLYGGLLLEYKKLFKTTRRLVRMSDRNEAELRRLRGAAEQAQKTLSRYFSPNLAREIVGNENFLDLRGERRELTFLFTDLAGFTSLVEQLEPAVTVQILNEYLDTITQIVYRNGGTTEKIVGDALHVIFGAPEAQSDQVARSVACALEIDAFAESFRQQKIADGIPLGVTRIGLHTGSAMLGNFGGELFFDYTAHGDAINTAARLESVNRYLGTRICASGAIAERDPGFIGRPVGSLLLSGKTESLPVFEPITNEQFQSPRVKAYMEAFKLLEIKDTGSKQAFAGIVAQYGEDPLAIFHLVRLLAGDTGVEIVVDGK